MGASGTSGTSGTSGEKEPQWPSSDSPQGEVTEDGEIVWVKCG